MFVHLVCHSVLVLLFARRGACLVPVIVGTNTQGSRGTECRDTGEEATHVGLGQRGELGLSRSLTAGMDAAGGSGGSHRHRRTVLPRLKLLMVVSHELICSGRLCSSFSRKMVQYLPSSCWVFLYVLSLPVPSLLHPLPMDAVGLRSCTQAPGSHLSQSWGAHTGLEEQSLSPGSAYGLNFSPTFGTSLWLHPPVTEGFGNVQPYLSAPVSGGVCTDF